MCTFKILCFCQDDFEDGQEGPHEVDWRTHRKWGYNSGGLQARLRRNLLRMQQQLLREQRVAWGLPSPGGSLGQQLKEEQSKTVVETMKDASMYKAGLEKAAAAAAVDSQDMARLGKALVPTPPWRMGPPPGVTPSVVLGGSKVKPFPYHQQVHITPVLGQPCSQPCGQPCPQPCPPVAIPIPKWTANSPPAPQSAAPPPLRAGRCWSRR